MKIAFDHQTFTLQAFGGISRYFTQLAFEFIARRHEVRIFAPLYQNRYIGELPAGVVRGHQLQRFPRKTTTPILHLNRVLTGPLIRHWAPDVLHETYYTQRSRVIGRRPTVVTVYDMIHEIFTENVPAGDPTTQQKRDAVARADRVICISKNTRDDLVRLFGVDERKLDVVHLAFDPFPPSDVPPALPALKRPFLLFVGHRGGYKNFANLLHAVAASSRLAQEFDIVAFGGPPLSDGELQSIGSLGLRPEQVHYLRGGDDMLAVLYARAQALVYPSRYEGFGIPPLEAMTYECPVICSHASSLPEVAGEAAEYFSPLDVDDMRQAIERVVFSDTRSAELRVAGLQRCAQFSWSRCAEQTLAIYESLR